MTQNPFAGMQPIRDPDLFDDVLAYCRRFIAYPSSDAAIAHVLWAAHTHAMEAWYSTPRLAFLSPEPGSGKTRAIEITEVLVPNPVEAVNVTPAYLFRKVADAPTILFDEIDTVFGPKAKDNEEIRGMLNAGHRKGAHAGRCVVRGKSIETEEIEAYCAVAMAGLGNLPDTILSRSIVVRMRRRSAGELVQPFRRRKHEAEGHRLRELISNWAASQIDLLADQEPTMPDGIADRDADVWEPLIVIADAIGGDWPNRARVAAVALVADSKRSTPSLGLRLLSDIRSVFGEDDQVPTVLLLERLNSMDEAPWGNLRGSTLDARSLARLLSKYEIKSTTIRTESGTPKGYRRSDLVDAWDRYLSPPHPSSATSATSATMSTADLVPGDE